MQDIELANVSQEVTERFCSLLGVGNNKQCPSRVNHVGPMRPSASRNVRYAPIATELMHRGEAARRANSGHSAGG
jgi:hypothetical protein